MNQPIVIAGVEVEFPSFLAPMAGHTDIVYRDICREHGCGVVLTELVSAEGIIRHMPVTMEYLETSERERPVGAQIFGSDPSSLAEAGEIIENLGRFDFIDINCGCPVPKIISKGAGVALMKEPEKLHDMIKAVKAAVSIPVSAKTRIGLSEDEINIREVALAIQEGGADFLAIHARVASNRHSGPADWDALADIKSITTIPIIGNGGIWAPEDAIKMQEMTKVDGVMLGRAAIGNPWIFDQIRKLWKGESYDMPTRDERKEVLGKHLKGLIHKFATSCRRRKTSDLEVELSACRYFRPQLLKYLAGFKGVHALSKRVGELNSVSEVLDGVDEVLLNMRQA